VKILLFSNPRTALSSSYGKQAGYLCDIWKQLGHEVYMVGHPFDTGGPQTIDGTITFPSTNVQYSQDSIKYRAKQVGADIVISLMDLFVLNPSYYPEVKHVCYFPVDTDRLRPSDHEVLKAAWDKLSFSKYGQQKAIEAGHDAGFIPLCVNTDLFQPMDKKACRESFNLPVDGFIFGTVAANNEPWPTRKGWRELFEAFTIFLNENPDSNAYLYVHSPAFGSRVGGSNLPQLAAQYGIVDRVRFTLPEVMVDGIPEQSLAQLYNCFDVYVTASKGEGFCLPLVEAQSCGVPVISGTWTALEENSFAGVSIPEKSFVETFLPDGTPFTAEIPYCTLEPAQGVHQEGCYRYAVLSQALAQAMTQYYRFPEEEKRVHSEAAHYAAKRFHPKHVAYLWKQQFDKWEKRLAEESAVTQKSGRVRYPADYEYASSVIRANETEADVVLVCPSYGERCGIAEYTGYQAWELYKGGVKAFIATTVAEAIKVAQGCNTVRSIIVHHEYSLFDDANPQLSMGESLPVVLRQLKSLATAYRDSQSLDIGDRVIKVAVIQHTVSPHAMHDGINKLLTGSGVPLYATSYAGVNYLSSNYNAKVNHCPLGTWSIPASTPQFKRSANEELVIGNFGMLGPQRDLKMCAEVCKATDAVYLGSHASNHKPYIDEVAKLFENVPHQIFTDWPDDVEIQNRLSACDIILMPRYSGVYYSSASIISAMNARRPIIVNHDPGYADLEDVVCIAYTTEKAIEWVNRLRDPAEYHKAVDKIEQYLANRNIADVLKKAGLV